VSLSFEFEKCFLRFSTKIFLPSGALYVYSNLKFKKYFNMFIGLKIYFIIK